MCCILWVSFLYLLLVRFSRKGKSLFEIEKFKIGVKFKLDLNFSRVLIQVCILSFVEFLWTLNCCSGFLARLLRIFETGSSLALCRTALPINPPRNDLPILILSRGFMSVFIEINHLFIELNALIKFCPFSDVAVLVVIKLQSVSDWYLFICSLVAVSHQMIVVSPMSLRLIGTRRTRLHPPTLTVLRGIMTLTLCASIARRAKPECWTIWSVIGRRLPLSTLYSLFSSLSYTPLDAVHSGTTERTMLNPDGSHTLEIISNRLDWILVRRVVEGSYLLLYEFSITTVALAFGSFLLYSFLCMLDISCDIGAMVLM